MVPRSLRWDVLPGTDGGNDKEWFTFFNDAGIDLLKLLIVRKKKNLAWLNTDINMAIEHLNPFLKREDYIMEFET